MAEEPKKEVMEEKKEEKALMADTPPAQVEEKKDDSGDMKVMIEQCLKAQEDLAARVSKIEEALDAVAKEEEGETTPENNKVDAGDAGLATYSKDMQSVKEEVAGVKKLLEPMVAHFANMGFKKTVASSARVETDPYDMTSTFEKLK